MGPRKPILDGKLIDLDTARQGDDNLLHQLALQPAQSAFYKHLKTIDLAAIVAAQLRIPQKYCEVAPKQEWKRGSFNCCIPIRTNDKRVMLRIPLPYKLGEERNPGNVDEKVRCEAATYIWIQEHCPQVPTPELLGFGLSDGSQFMLLRNCSLLVQVQRYVSNTLRRLLSIQCPSQYICYNQNFGTDYILTSFIEEAEPLGLCFDLQEEGKRQKNLYTDLARIMISMSKIPLPTIGSFTIDQQCHVSLTNRPLTLHLVSLENQGLPTNIPRNMTYTRSEPYLSDLLACHDSKLRHQPNSIHDDEDGQYQMAALVTMRSLLPNFLKTELRSGPFALQFTDLHSGNILVDRRTWHVKAIIDLEFACSLPLEMQRPPYCLYPGAVDALSEEEYNTFSRVNTEFIAVYERECEEHKLPILYSIMNSIWTSGGYFYFEAINDAKGLCNFFLDRVLPIYGKYSDFENTFKFWSPTWSVFISSKILERHEYMKKLEEDFDWST